MILVEKQNELDAQLSKYIKELAKGIFDSETIKEYALRLRDLYAIPDYRHSYSQFFPIISEIYKDKSSSVEFLMNNFEALKEMIEINYLKDTEKEFETLYKPLRKLSDHINLEIVRYQIYNEKEELVNTIETQLKTATNSLNFAKTELENANKKINSMQTEFITVLSIFAAIAIGFSGGLNFLGNALQQSSQLQFAKHLLLVLLCGFILVNFVFTMMYFIAKITGRNIYARCKTVDCTCKDNKAPSCNGINRIRKRLPYIFWFNVVVIVLIICDIFLIDWSDIVAITTVISQ